MEHLDLAGVITTPTMWSMPAFDQQDAIYLSSSRQMLEPILEETSEDEEHAQNSWNQNEHGTSFWSSAESETGSVIRIEVNKDPDSISERDFACPAKRARRCDEFLIGGAAQPPPQLQLPQPNTLDDSVLLRRYQRTVDFNDLDSNSLERFLAYEACTRDSWGAGAGVGAGVGVGAGSQQRNSTGSRRFDDYSDADSLSYQSLSRSSSLIQFESLERQLLLQEQHASMTSLGNSSPSLLSFDGANNTTEDGARSGANSGSNSGNNSRRGSQISLLKRFESSDGRLHQTYFDLDKLNFDEDQRVLFGAGKTCSLAEATIGEVKSDSESSTSSSGSSSGNSILTASKPSAEDLTDSSCAVGVRNGRIMAFQRAGKSSAENLSEDSGYCEPSTLRRAKSKSIPKNFEKFCEEEEEFQQQQFERADADAAERHAYGRTETAVDNAQNNNKTTQQHSKNSTNTATSSHIIHYVGERDICQPKINDATFTVVESNAEIAFHEPAEAASAAAAATAPSPSPPPAPTSPLEVESPCPLYYERVKNSPAREAQLLEQRRSLAHSPSPVSSDASGSSCGTARSSSSASTCASAASFTWLPTPLQLQQQRQRQKQQQQQQLLQRAAQLPNKQTLDEFCASLRNSLPDIRDVLGSEASLVTYGPGASERNGHGLEHSRKTTTTTTTTRGINRTTIPDDSDIGSTSASASAHDSRSDETDAESTPETRKRTVGNVGGGGGGGNGSGSGNSSGSGGGAYYVNRTRILSVPSELNKLGRRKRNKAPYRYNKSSTDEATSYSDSSAAEDDDFFDDSCLKIRRSCSWSERRERNLQRFEDNFGGRSRDERRCRWVTQSGLGYMNASYQNLTLLDYSGEQPSGNQANLKRCGGSMDTPKSSSSADYESIICKGNFLLDELSEIYDRNASILNDKPADSAKEVAAMPLQSIRYGEMDVADGSPSPRAPPRQRKHSNSSYSDLECGADEAVQHVQLTIRKPPARQKNVRKGEATNSLISEPSGKTFDQDPTNLRTSYAQSLEKCNFDTRELSNTELTKANAIPKRRFHSQASATKQRNLVSSTPNLNAFDPRADEIDDDMYVSSAHTSMHQLPQSTAQKPLGILLPAGSRVSFGKEVSFCPVVSKYSWQEQSSEECNDPQAPQDGRDDEETDDELLDNADATVIYNTRENELIAARFKANANASGAERPIKSVAHIRAAPAQVEKVRATVILRASGEEQRADGNIARPEHQTKTSHEAEPTAEAIKLVSSETSRNEVPAAATQPVAVSHKPTIVDATTSDSNVDESNRYNDNSDSGTGGNTGGTGQTRPLSIQLPILSEPPTNRAHHILYASQQLLDNFQRREREQFNNEGGGAVVADRRAKSVNNLSVGPNRARMSNEAAVGLGNSSGANNNNELLKTKFKDEKHPSSKGFLSRFANGFRFSLRRNKKKRLQQQKEQQLAEQNGSSEKQQPQQAQSQSPYKSGKEHSPDFIYIPLKGPLPAGSHAVSQNNGNTAAAAVAGNKASATSTGKQQPPQQQPQSPSEPQLTHSSSAKLVTGKPPLPKQPPRSATLPASMNNATILTRYFGSGRWQQGANSAHAQNAHSDATAANFKVTTPPSRSQFYTDFLDAERSYYDEFESQLNSGMQANGRAAAADAQNAHATRDPSEQPLTDYESARSSISPEATMLLTGNGVAGAGLGVGVGAAAVGGGAGAGRIVANAYVQQHNNNKIGLIETNLDTHETVISGKTRSLIDIVGPPQPVGRRLNMSAVSGRNGHGRDRDRNGDDEDNDVYGDGDDDDVAAGVAGGMGGVVIKTTTQSGSQIASVRRPHKSMEFLLDKENQKNVLVCIS